MSLKSGRRYQTESEETQFEPGSRGRVLKNLLSIKKKRELDTLEWQKLEDIHKQAATLYGPGHHFTAADICKMHKMWLGNIYSWAGQYRQVNMEKEGFPFAAAQQVPFLMQKFEKEQLKKWTPCCFSSLDEIAQAIAITHTEFILIHPFREGNGRLGRLLIWLMALQAGLPPLNFGGIEGKKKQEYFAAVRSGLDNNYEPMKKIFASVIRRTLRIYKK
jgi:cell filamentation protein, protein adenylyltransferase